MSIFIWERKFHINTHGIEMAIGRGCFCFFIILPLMVYDAFFLCFLLWFTTHVHENILKVILNWVKKESWKNNITHYIHYLYYILMIVHVMLESHVHIHRMTRICCVHWAPLDVRIRKVIMSNIQIYKLTGTNQKWTSNTVGIFFLLYICNWQSGQGV